jgi:exosortase
MNRWWIPLAVSGLLLAVLLFLFPFNSGDSSISSPLGIALWTIWTTTGDDTPDHTYCLLVPLMLGYLLYEGRSRFARAPIQGSTSAIAWVLIGLFLFWVGARAGKQYLGCAGIQLLLLGIVTWFWGPALFRQLIFAWAILIFAWPLPFLDTAVAFPLRMMVSHTAYYVLNIAGIATLQSGTALISAPTTSLPIGSRFQIDVADPCSGLHSLLPLLMFSSFYCYFFLPRTWQKWTVFLSSFVFTIAGNVARIVLLVTGCLLWGSAFAVGTNDVPSRYHEGCGFAVFVIVLGLECLFGSFLIALDRRRSNPSECPVAAPAADFSPRAVPNWRSATILGIAAIMLVIFLVSPLVYLPTESGIVMNLPERVKLSHLDGGDFFGNDADVSEVEHRMLPKDTLFARKNYQDFHDHNIFFSIVLSGVQQYTIHPPEVCLVAQGWSIVKHEDIPIELASGHSLVVRNLSLERQRLDSENQAQTVKAFYMYWYVADDLTTPSHIERNLWSSWDRVVHNRDHRWAYVIAMSPVTETLFRGGMNEAQTRDMLKDFIREIVPTFQKSELKNPITADNS